jgi:hypothetical protein
MEESQQIKFAINDTLDGVFQEIVAVLPQVKTDWSCHLDEEKKKPYYTTEINGVELEVHERKVVFKINKGGLKQETRTFEKLGPYQKPKNIEIYKALVRRFKDHDDHTFYKRVLRFMNGHLTSQTARIKHNGIQLTEEEDSGENS